MTDERSPFGMRLWRLLAHRRPTVATTVEEMVLRTASVAGVGEAELQAVVDGAVPSGELMERLAPVLNIPLADLYVIAGLPVPLGEASAWPTKPWDVGYLLRQVAPLSRERIAELGELIRAMPVEPRTEPAPADGFPESPGALLVRLAKNRNIKPHNAWVMRKIAGGPYVSDSTIWSLGAGRVVVTPLYVTAFAHLLGYDPADMVALAGVGPVVENARPVPEHAALAALACDARRLTGDQIRQVLDAAGVR
ncbi:hypothetical protein AB0J83_18205 [Actinoplanes sp. NPDC049596]|uniref:hypothetical protein n=1 Tax=unclassified Actinoplanes TaxID=2626549 RepID=UPI0034468C2E